MGVWIVGRDLHRVLAAQIRALDIAAAGVELCHIDVFGFAVVGGLQLGADGVDAMQDVPPGRRVATLAALVFQARGWVGCVGGGRGVSARVGA